MRRLAPGSESGFTLVELLVVLALGATLMMLALPAFQGLLARRSVEAVADALVADFRLARSEAMQRGLSVSLCSSGDGQTCAAPASWKDGWLVFVDEDGDGQRDADDLLLRVQPSTAGVASVGSSQPANDRVAFTFQITGLARAASQTFLIVPAGESAAGLTRLVCISSQGRAALRAAGAEACA